MKRNIIELFKTIFESIIIVFIFMTFIGIPVRVVGNSMYPNLHDGDFGFAGVFTKWFPNERFDIVILDNDLTNDKIVKRIIGLPNELIEYKNNKLYVNGNYVEEPFIIDNYTEDFSILLKDDEYLCLGDNRMNSKDSRFYGAFNKKDIKAKNIMIILPFKDLGFK